MSVNLAFKDVPVMVYNSSSSSLSRLVFVTPLQTTWIQQHALKVRTKLSQDAETIFKGKKQTRTTMLKVILNRLLVTVFGLETLLISGVVQTYWTS